MKDVFLNNKRLAFVFSIVPFLIIIGGVSCAPKSMMPQGDSGSLLTKGDEARAIEEAQKIFAEKKSAGVDMSNGPCLSNEIIPDWVADVVHDPRQPVDNDPANQCQTYRDGKAHHFVELDTEGRFIQAR